MSHALVVRPAHHERVWRSSNHDTTLNSNLMPVHRLASLTWPAVRDLPAARTVAVLPAGAIEAHGPHLPLGTDVIIAEAMARAGAERLSARGLHVVLLPALTMAPAPFAAAFAGTVDAAPDATTMMVVGVARSLAAHGKRECASRPGACGRTAPRRDRCRGERRERDRRVSRFDDTPMGGAIDAGVPERRMSCRPVRKLGCSGGAARSRAQRGDDRTRAE